MSESTLKHYMSKQHRMALGSLPTYHSHCLDKCGVARPGKTARERAKKARP